MTQKRADEKTRNDTQQQLPQRRCAPLHVLRGLTWTHGVSGNGQRPATLEDTVTKFTYNILA